MKQESTSQAQISSGAVEATVRLAHQLGIARVNPVILHESQHVSIRLFPADVVARVVVSADAEATRRMTRELRVARHLIENAAPVVGPCAELPAGPHVEQGFVLTLWEFVEHTVADGDNVEHVARAAAALRRVHRALCRVSR